MLSHEMAAKAALSEYSFRTMEEWKACTTTATSIKNEKGITGSSILLQLDYIDLTKICTGELLHDFMSGFLKKMLKSIKSLLSKSQWDSFERVYCEQRYPYFFP